MSLVQKSSLLSGLLLLLLSCASVHRSSLLSWEVGDWQGTRTAQDDGKRIPMTLHVERLSSDSVMERLQVNNEPRPYVSFTVRRFDRTTGRWEMFYGNTSRSSISRLAGRFEGGRIDWVSLTAPGESKLVAERAGADQWRRTQYISSDRGKNWNVLFVDELSRVPPRSP